MIYQLLRTHYQKFLSLKIGLPDRVGFLKFCGQADPHLKRFDRMVMHLG